MNEKMIELLKNSEIDLRNEYYKIDQMCLRNSANILKAFQEFNISDMHFNQTTGYGYDDIRKRYN